MKKNYFIILLIFFILFSILYVSKFFSIFEGINFSREILVTDIVNNNTYSNDDKMKLLKDMNIGDNRYSSIIGNTLSSNDYKIKSLQNLIVTSSTSNS